MDVVTFTCHFQGQRQIEETVLRVDMETDIQTLVKENSITAEDHKAEFLMADYFVSLKCLARCGRGDILGPSL